MFLESQWGLLCPLHYVTVYVWARTSDTGKVWESMCLKSLGICQCMGLFMVLKIKFIGFNHWSSWTRNIWFCLTLHRFCVHWSHRSVTVWECGFVNFRKYRIRSGIWNSLCKLVWNIRSVCLLGGDSYMCPITAVHAITTTNQIRTIVISLSMLRLCILRVCDVLCVFVRAILSWCP